MKARVLRLVRTPLHALRRAHRRWSARDLQPVRRIDRVSPLSDRRVVAMTFDDGPTSSPARPAGEPLTATILDILERYGARGTFNIIGSTSENYPDKAGKPHTLLWSGVAYDHYPEFGQDLKAGAANQPDLVERMLRGGHEIASHSYRHLAFGPMKLVYGTRAHYRDSAHVREDLERLHDLIASRFGYVMKLARPPHYIDHTADGKNAYDIYASLGYQYLAASFDGGGWRPTTGDYEADVRAMVNPLEAALSRDPGSLNGQVIFHKDGYNMSGQSPVVDALPRYLDLLQSHGYKVITVSSLLSLSPFADLDTEAPYFPAVRQLVADGRIAGYRDNTFRPDAALTWGQLAVMLSLSGPVDAGRAMEAAVTKGWLPRGRSARGELSWDDLARTARRMAGDRVPADLIAGTSRNSARRGEAAPVIHFMASTTRSE